LLRFQAGLGYDCAGGIIYLHLLLDLLRRPGANLIKLLCS
jgi:hypothetical protein